MAAKLATYEVAVIRAAQNAMTVCRFMKPREVNWVRTVILDSRDVSCGAGRVSTWYTSPAAFASVLQRVADRQRDAAQVRLLDLELLRPRRANR